MSGKRGGFGSLIRTMKLINEDSDLELQLVVTDMHLSSKFGKTLVEVEKNFKVSAVIDMKQRNGTPEARSEAIGICKQEITKVFHRLKPDIFLCLGDRGEVLVSVIAANNLRIPVAHIQGGDVSGNLDEVFRHAI
ncbi:UDP-N-acetylglucosamine 2-epimerase, partial [Candidatus Parcubacteria bacterium]|nr:UDP-N-acetylglucosamine 2-epimerase [Candidatus Parcubacteria bacterium]